MPDLMCIVVKNQFEGIHNYPNAPEEVSFLRTPHRHIFKLETEIEVFHDDRELEFIMVQRRINEFFELHEGLKHRSCEMIAKELREHLRQLYPLPDSVGYRNSNYSKHRVINIKVFEDGENGVYLREA